MNWFYSINGQQVGPVSETDFDSLIAAGVLRADTLVWKEGMQSWQPLTAVRPVGNAVSGVPPSYTAPLPPITPAGSRYAGFWLRFVAHFIDQAILQVVIVIVAVIIAVPFGLLTLLTTVGENPQPEEFLRFIPAIILIVVAAIGISFAYEVYFLQKKGATPGKMALGLRVIRTNGEAIAAGSAAARFFAKMLSALPINIGYIIAGFDDQKRALHDHICNTRVIRG